MDWGGADLHACSRAPFRLQVRYSALPFALNMPQHESPTYLVAVVVQHPRPALLQNLLGPSHRVGDALILNVGAQIDVVLARLGTCWNVLVRIHNPAIAAAASAASAASTTAAIITTPTLSVGDRRATAVRLICGAVVVTTTTALLVGDRRANDVLLFGGASCLQIWFGDGQSIGR